MSEVFYQPVSDVGQVEQIVAHLLSISSFQELDCHHKTVALFSNAVAAESPAYDIAYKQIVRALEERGAKVIQMEGHSRNEAIVPIPDGLSTKSAHIAKEVVEADIVVSVNHIMTTPLCGFTGAVSNTGFGGASELGLLELVKANDEERHTLLAEYSAAISRNHQRFHLTVAMDISDSETGKIVLPDYGILVSHDMVAIDEAIGDLINRGELPEESISFEAAQTLLEMKKEGNELMVFNDRPWDHIRKINPVSNWPLIMSRADRMGLGTRSYALFKDGKLVY